MRALVERGDSPAKSKQASVAARKAAESRDLTVRVFARRWIDETLFYRSTDADADADADGTGNRTVGQADERVSSPPDGLGGWPLKSRQSDRQASALSARRVKGALVPGCARP